MLCDYVSGTKPGMTDDGSERQIATDQFDDGSGGNTGHSSVSTSASDTIRHVLIDDRTADITEGDHDE